MRQTLIQIPHEWNGLSVFGWGWALILWAIVSLVVLVVAARNATLKHALTEWGVFLAAVALGIIFVLPAIELRSVAPNGQIIPKGIAIRGYGVMMGVAIMAAVALAAYRAQKRGIHVDTILGMATWLVVLGIAGGRIFYLIQFWDDFKQPSLIATLGEAVNLTQGGLVVYGAFLGGFVAFCYYIWKHQLNFLRLADVVVPSLMVGLALGRLGCFLNGCCYGGPTDQAWGVSFPPASVPYAEHVQSGMIYGLSAQADAEGNVIAEVQPDSQASSAGLKTGSRIVSINGELIDSADTEALERSRQLLALNAGHLILETEDGKSSFTRDSLPARTCKIHPTQLYSAITAALICAFLISVEPFLGGNGRLFAMWMTVYPPARFLLEVIRTDGGAIGGTGLTIAQIVSLLIGTAAICFWVFLWRTKSDKLAA